MDLDRCLDQQEKAAEQQHEIASGDLYGAPRDHEQGLCELGNPREREQQQDPRDHRKPEPQQPRRVALFRREPAHEDREKDDVVDTEDNLESRQGCQRGPCFRARHPIEHALIIRVRGPAD